MSGRLFVIVAATAALAAALWFALRGPAPSVEPAPRRPGSYSIPAAASAPVEPPPEIRYVNVAPGCGVAFHHENGADGRKLLPETLGSGVALFDYDGDGRDDVLLLNGDYWPGKDRGRPHPTSRLFHNDGSMKFSDVTEAVGLNVALQGMGVTAADFDGDGRPDLFMTTVGGYRLYRNTTTGFVDTTTASGLDAGTWKDPEGRQHGAFATSAAALDFDGDGLVDIFVCHYVRWSEATDIWSSMDGTTKAYAQPTQYQGESCRLWRNLGGMKFEDVTDRAGLRNDEGKSLGVCVCDINADHWPDLVVANDTQPNYLYRNNRNGTFTEIGTDATVAFGPDGRAHAGMGVDSGTVTDDARPAIAIGNFSGEPVSLFELVGPELFVNRAEQYRIALVTHQPLKFGVLFVDADQDGRPDLMLANGHIEPTIQAVHGEISYRQSMQLLRNIRGRGFSDVSSACGPDFVVPRVGRALAVADLDNDGDLDVVVTENGGPAAVLRCDLPRCRALSIRLRGAAPATDALGAEVSVTAGNRTQTLTVRTGSSYLSLSTRTLFFGLGDFDGASRVAVRWPDGAESSYAGPFAAGRRIVIDRASGVSDAR